MSKRPTATELERELERGDEAIDKVVAIVTRAAQATTEAGFDEVLEEANQFARDVPAEHHASLQTWVNQMRAETFARIARDRSAEPTRLHNAAIDQLERAEVLVPSRNELPAFLEAMKPLRWKREWSRVQAVIDQVKGDPR